MPNKFDFGAGAGSRNSGISAGALSDVYGTANNMIYNGTAFSNIANNINYGDYSMGAGASNTAALIYGGQPIDTATNRTEKWNGSNWSTLPNMLYAAFKGRGVGTSTNALCWGGAATGTVALNSVSLYISKG
jgi:hypothetical protein